jgi:hypothetical protein
MGQEAKQSEYGDNIVIVKLFDKTELIISQNAADKLTASLRRDPQGYVTINGMVIKKTAIALVKPGGEPPIEKNYNMIEAPDNRGVDSSAKERIRQALKNGRLKDLSA